MNHVLVIAVLLSLVLFVALPCGGYSSEYEYNSRGLQNVQTDALDRTTRYEYDAMVRRTARILPEGQREEMTYDTLGRLTELKDFNGSVITRTYDPTNDRLLAIAAPANHPSLTLSQAPARYEFAYDILGRRTAAVVKNASATAISSESYFYDIHSRLTGYAGPTGGIGYAYDANDNLAGAKSSTPGGYDISYDYDALNRLTDVYRGQEGIDPNASGLAAYNYDANGNLNGVGYANGVQHAYGYNAMNRLAALAVTSSDPQSTIPNLQSLHNYGYTLDANGMRTRITEHSGRTIDHIYDKLLRLKSETITGGYTGDPNGTLNYTYDAVGNRTSRSTVGTSGPAGPTLQSLLPNQTHSFTANDRLTSDTYDANGNTVSSQITNNQSQITNVEDVYSFDNRLIRRVRSDGKVINITYNADGHRLYKHITQGGLTTGLHHYLTDANNPTGYAQVIEEKNPLAPAGDELTKVHLYGHDLISSLITDHSALITSAQFYQYDGLGSVRSITDEDGLITETYDYDAYGNLIGLAKWNATSGELESSPINHNGEPITQSEFLFTGEQWDADLGMYFLRARYLNTTTGRFHIQDTYEGRNGEPLTLHKYLYAHGNPAMFTDPSGYLSIQQQVIVQSSLVALTSIGNYINFLSSFNSYQSDKDGIPDAAVVGISAGGRGRGGVVSGVHDFLVDLKSFRVYYYGGISGGLEPLSFFSTKSLPGRGGLTMGATSGLIWNLSNPESWSGLGTSSTLPLHAARILGRMLTGTNAPWGAMMQIARRENHIRFRDLAFQFTNSSSGAGGIRVGPRSSTFTTEIGYLSKPIEITSLSAVSQEFGPKLFELVATARQRAMSLANDFGKSLDY